MPMLWALGAMRTVGLMLYAPNLRTHVVASVAVSACFALLAWRLRSATPAAAASGGVICLCLIYGTHVYGASVVHSALVPLIVLFALTFVATRAGRKRKAANGLAESRSGRSTSQVVANLGFAALAMPLSIAAVLLVWRVFSGSIASVVTAVCVSSALAEAAADTVSSEIGQAFGGKPILIITLRAVEPGTDGGISLRGTLAGIFAAVIVGAAGTWSMQLSLRQSLIALIAGICGLFFDSLLGATLERRGYLGNDLVNFCSTAFSTALCLIVLWLVPGLGPRPLVIY
jgi:uncharacterized protein (TIGR00297 family)